MSSENMILTMSDGHEIFLRSWNKVKKPIGVVQIIHGMAEHSKRYNEFAVFLNKLGYIVVADDHRGHGLSLSDDENPGYIGENGFHRIVGDEKQISNLINEKYWDLPLYLFAHSFGSFIGQEYIIQYSNNISGIIFSGSAKQDGLDITMGRFIANFQKIFLNDKKEAKLIDQLSFGSFNKKFTNENQKFTWLTRDQKEVIKYEEDELCGFISPINFYYHLFNAFPYLYQKHRLKRISKNLPILIISGDMDPVGNYGKSVKKLYKQYRQLEIKNVQLKLFKNARHELINETNYTDVFHYIESWLEKI